MTLYVNPPIIRHPSHLRTLSHCNKMHMALRVSDAQRAFLDMNQTISSRSRNLLEERPLTHYHYQCSMPTTYKIHAQI